MFYNVYHHFPIFNVSVFFEPNATGGGEVPLWSVRTREGDTKLKNKENYKMYTKPSKGGYFIVIDHSPLRKRRRSRSYLKKRRSLTKSLSRLPGRKKKSGKKGGKERSSSNFFYL